MIPGSIRLFEGNATEALYAVLDQQGSEASMAEVALSTPRARTLNELSGQLIAWGLEARIVPTTFEAFKSTIDAEQPVILEGEGGFAVGVGYSPDQKQAVIAAAGGKKLLLKDRELAEVSRQMVMLVPQPGRRYRRMARMHATQGDLETALGMYRQAVQADPKDWQARLGEAQCLALLSRLDEAREAFVAVLGERKEEAEAMGGLAAVLLRKNDNLNHALSLAKEAVRLFEAQLKNDLSAASREVLATKLGQALSTLADLYQHQGQDREAAEALKRSMEYIPVELRAARLERIRALKQSPQPDSKD